MITHYKHQRNLRRKRIRAKISGTVAMPRLSVFRSNKFIYAQIINDEKGHTLVSVHGMINDKKDKMKKTDKARAVGREIAEKALKLNIKKIVFDRGGYSYLGRVKALADGAREGGLEF